MSASQVDEYLRALGEPQRTTLEAVRQSILATIPDADQVISYRVPAFRLEGATVVGFAAFRNHLSYLPFSGSVLVQLGDRLTGYSMTKSALHFPIGEPLRQPLVEELITVRLREIGQPGR